MLFLRAPGNYYINRRDAKTPQKEEREDQPVRGRVNRLERNATTDHGQRFPPAPTPPLSLEENHRLYFVNQVLAPGVSLISENVN